MGYRVCNIDLAPRILLLRSHASHWFHPGYWSIGVFVRSYHYGAAIAELIEMPFMLICIAFWAMFMVIRFDIPKFAWIRLAIGLLGMAFMLATELVGRIIIYGNPWPTSMSKTEILAKGTFAACSCLDLCLGSSCCRWAGMN